MEEIIVPARLNELNRVQDFVRAHLCGAKIPAQEQMPIELVVEEAFVNIVNYAYNPGHGDAVIRCAIGGGEILMEFLDAGKPYNPLECEDPDISRTAEQREPGGLGVFLIKQIMDEVKYRYKDGKNVLTMRKKLMREDHNGG